MGDPTHWTLDGANNYILTNGFSSGGLERNVIATKPEAIGYLGLADYSAISTSANALTFNGKVERGADGSWNRFEKG